MTNASSILGILVAARALIDTPEKFRFTSPDQAVDQVTNPKSSAREQAYQAVRDAKPDGWVAADWGDFDSVMGRFDRAIAAQKLKTRSLASPAVRSSEASE